MKQILLAFALFFTTVSFAQNSNLTAGKNAINENNYSEAYKKLKAASTHKKTMNNPEVWTYLSMVYSGLQTFSEDVISSLGIEPITEELIFSTMEKATSLDNEGKYAEQLKEVKQQLVNNANNSAVGAYQSDNFELSATEFTRKVELSKQFDIPVDITDLVNIGSLYSNQLEMPDKGIRFFEQAVDMGSTDPGVHYSVINYYRDNNPEAYMAALKKAQELVPEERNFKLLELDVYIQDGTIDSKLDELMAAANADPSDANLALVISTVFEQKEDFVSQFNWVQKALKAEPDNFIATLNAGISLFNQAVEHHNIMNDASSYDAPEYKEAKVKRDQLAEQALPYLNKAYELDPEKENVVYALWQFHTMMENNDLAAKFEALYDQE